MFTGIIKSIGSIRDTKKENGGMVCVIDTGLSKLWKKGESISLCGICSTILQTKRGRVEVFFMKETVFRTTVASWKKGDRVNVEPSLRLGDELSGHMVSGHVDGVGKVLRSVKEQGQQLLEIELPKECVRTVVEKGSIAIDGVSLTIVKVRGKKCSVALIPSTQKHTTLESLKRGDQVNIECDVFAKYCESLLTKYERAKKR